MFSEFGICQTSETFVNTCLYTGQCQYNIMSNIYHVAVAVAVVVVAASAITTVSTVKIITERTVVTNSNSRDITIYR